ncbi:phosphotransferase [Rhodococcus opacus]|uniref:phosphotransferase enzyme family protein n=1 Tax=Rhodococcus opacus TaxID=37919 RepID=UPI001FF53781|nr:phosphotransferase [Rhodococcus opacus]UOT03277.1 phosphotransferase [Rhodococcus opacus]
MTDVPSASTAQVLAHARQVLAEALPRFGFAADTPAERLPVSENVAYRLRPDDGAPVVLRISRPGGYDLRTRESELAWVSALSGQAGAPVPGVHPADDGTLVITVRPPGSQCGYHVSAFECVPGLHPPEEEYAAVMPQLGAITGHLHEHASRWQRPRWFTRPAWDVDAAFGSAPRWGSWRAGVHERDEIEQLVRVEEFVRDRLGRFGRGPDRFGLIHADMRAANLLVDGTDCRIIDFDDCGPGWFLYDLATAMTFAEDHPDAGDFIAAWLQGYRSVRDLPAEHEREIDTFLLLRRMLTIAFLGNNPDIDVSRQMLPGMARATCDWADTILTEQAARS